MIIEGTRMSQNAEDVVAPVALDCMRAYCPNCQSDVPAEYHCLWAETGESWCTCTICYSWEAEAQWSLSFYGERAPVLDVFYVRLRGPVVTLGLRGKRGDIITDGCGRWVIVAVETHCVQRPPLPWGFLVDIGIEPPAVGTQVWIEPGPDHDSLPWPMESP